ncbi:hypothetical protein DPX16_23470 [Anabarilius grahami]|uniref:Uncharacterized protein n=1 Tax=Anabarilius grahami TaxID=495550 RepID=A0A3N0XU38_ANAGA|nr:hypothetical protein DPX16_23470 [Anabarilius grahami]
MASPHSSIPQCSNSNEPERINQSEQQPQSPHGHIQMSSDCVPTHYPSEIKTDSARKNYKQKLLTNSPETLFADLFKTGEICNLIFFSDHPSAWHKAIINHYPSVKKEGICNGWKVKIREPHDPDSTVITVNIYKNGTVMLRPRTGAMTRPQRSPEVSAEIESTRSSIVKASSTRQPVAQFLNKPSIPA